MTDAPHHTQLLLVEMRVLRTFLSALTQTKIFLIVASSGVDRFTGLSHRAWALYMFNALCFLNNSL
jgi:hypothetical protein